jgi:ParB/RepB/Spo0J family partition protein
VTATAVAASVVSVPLDLIDPGPNDRQIFDRVALEALAESIRANGLLQPVTVRPVGGGRFELVAGERRVRACRLAGMVEVSALVVELEDEAASWGMLTENVARVDLDPVAEGRAYQARMERLECSAAEVARRAGVPASRVRARTGLLRLSERTLLHVRNGELPLVHAGAMVGLDPNRQHLALEAFHRGTVELEAFRSLCGRLADEQSADGFFDPDSFLAVDEYRREAEVQVSEDRRRERVVPVGIAEVADLCGARRGTVDVWRTRGLLPEPDLTVSGHPLWWPETISAWRDAREAAGRQGAPSRPLDGSAGPADEEPKVSDPVVPAPALAGCPEVRLAGRSYRECRLEGGHGGPCAFGL